MFPLTTLYRESGLHTLLHSPLNIHLIILTRTLRMFAFGFAALILALFLHSLSLSDAKIGLFYTLTLLGDVMLSLFLTLIADALGRRRILFFGAALMVLSGLTFAVAEHPVVLLVAAVLGVISPSGNEIGPFRAVEESMISGLTVPEHRTDVLSWYVVVPAVGTSLGLLACGNFVSVLEGWGWDEVRVYHACFLVYALVGVVNMGCAWGMGSECESGGDGGKSSQAARKKSSGLTDMVANISPDSRPTLFKLCGIMAIDSFSSGMAAYSLINLYLDRKFGLPKSTLGDTMSFVWAVSAFMNIWSASIARRIGLVKTMVVTHLPSAVFLALLAAPRQWWLTVVLLVARSSLSSMDQAPRTSFIAAIVRPDERTAVMGIVNVVKIAAQSAGPSVTGLFGNLGVFWLAFVVAGCLKVGYDISLLALFLQQKLHQHEPSRQGDAQSCEDEALPLAEHVDSEGDELQSRSSDEVW